MILAGIYGGIINFFLEYEKTKARSRLTIWQMMVIGICASLLVPLFLMLISSNLVNLKQLEFSKILVFFRFCLIAAIYSRRFIVTISERILKEIQEAKDVAAEAKDKVAEIEQQDLTDEEAISLVNKVLDDPDPDESPVSLSIVKDKIKNASVRTRTNIFFDARKFRQNNYKKDPEKLERLVPIFEALIESDQDAIYHRNNAQLGYILKDKKNKDYEGAREALSKAIEIRDRIGETGFSIYEFNRAICNIETDPNFKSGQPSSEKAKEAILSDLRIAAGTERWGTILEDEQKNKDSSIAKWFKLNKVDLNS
jgi:tetratricopeptide (TPR) repeat protein